MSLEDYADEIEVPDKCHIIAHSFGARVAVLLAQKYPDKIKKLVLTGPAGIKPRFSFWRWLKIRLHKLGFHQKGSKDYRKLSPTGKKTFQNVLHRNLRNEISQIAVPTLIIWGKRDTAVRRYMINRWTKLSPDTRIVIYKDAGHFCFIDHPDRFIIDTQNFLKGEQCSNV